MVIFVSIISGSLLCLFISLVWSHAAASAEVFSNPLQIYPDFNPAAQYVLSGCILFFCVYFFSHIGYTPCAGYFLKKGPRGLLQQTCWLIAGILLLGLMIRVAVEWI